MVSRVGFVYAGKTERVLASAVLLALGCDERRPSPDTHERLSIAKTADRVLGVHGLVIWLSAFS